MSLTDVKIRTAKPEKKPYKLFDGAGMFLLVKPNGSKLWQLKYRYMGKERTYSIGMYIRRAHHGALAAWQEYLLFFLDGIFHD